MVDTILPLLCNLPGISGWEDPVRDTVRKLAQEAGAAEIREDGIGNLYVLKRGAHRRKGILMACAHMDEVGLLVRGIDEDGVLRFGCVGGIDLRVLPGKRVLIGERGIPGVIGMKAVHLTEKKEREQIPRCSDFYLDTGDAEGISVGDPVFFPANFTAFGAGFLRSKALDDRLGCAVLLELLRAPLEYDTWLVFTVQEEIGLCGAEVAAYTLAPDAALVLEGTTAADIPGADGAARVCEATGGAVIGCVDRRTIYDPALAEQLQLLARQHQIPWQIKRMVAGGTDAGAICKSRSGVRCASIAAPVRYIHSPASVTTRAAAEAVRDLARLFCDAPLELRKDAAL